jgi:hypothetical protein
MKARALMVAAVATLLGAGGGIAHALPQTPGQALPSPPGVPLPVIVGADSPIHYDRPFVVYTPDAAAVVRVELTSANPPGRNKPVSVVVISRGADSITVAPPTQAAAPAGPYLLTIAVRVLGQLVSSLPWRLQVGAADPGSPPPSGAPSGSPAGRSPPPGTSTPPTSGGGPHPSGARGSGTKSQPKATTTRGSTQRTLPARRTADRSPLGRVPWLPVAVLIAFLATAMGLKRIS